MAILWMDGFEHYGATTTGRDNMVNYGQYASATGQISSTVARTGTYSFRCGSGDNLSFRRTFGTTKSSVGIGAAYYHPILPTVDFYHVLCQFNDSSNIPLISVVVNPTGQIEVWGGTSTIGGTRRGVTTNQVITPAVWNHVETYFTPNGASSSIEIKVNEVTVLTVNPLIIGSNSGAGAAATETSSVTVIGRGVTSNTFYVDDIYAWDDSGSYNNDFIGDKRVATLYPDADTSDADWTPNSGATGYTQIDENTPDADTTYITTSTVGDISEFDFGAMPTGAIGISAVQVYTAARKTDTGSADIRTDIVSNGVDTSGATQVLTTAYNMRTDVFEVDPDTGAQWTKAGVDAARIRVEREA